jgi:hypothetical protein
MFSKTLFVALSVLIMPLALGAALNPATVIDSHLTRRAGNHEAVIYTSIYCSGDVLHTEVNFGCGGTCFRFQGGASIFLQQDSNSRPYSTADLFSDSDCQTLVGRTDLSGLFSRCYPMGPESDITFNSFYLYNNC